MSRFYPTHTLRRVTELTPRLLEQWSIRALILDVDNTLTTHNNPLPDREVLEWLAGMKRRGVPLVILSNNREDRVKDFAARLGLAYTANAAKPLTAGFRRTARRLGLPPERIGVVGDQLFTDILGGNLFGAQTILVEPFEAETGPFFRLKRRLEQRILLRRARQGKDPRNRSK